MDIHKPSPVHGWRDFAKEVGIIVLGVLIALGAEQVAEAVHWRYQVEQSRQAMRLELSEDDALQAYARAAVTGCLDLQLSGMQRAVDSRASSAAIIALARSYQPPQRNWEMDAFQSTMASGASSHMAPDELTRWSSLYSAVPSMRLFTTKEADLIHSLRGGLATERPMAEADRDRVARALQGLRLANRAFDKSARFILYLTPALGAAPKLADRESILADARQVYGSCVLTPDLKAPPAIGSQFDVAHTPDVD